MSRFLAIKSKQGLTEDEFRSALDRTKKWRFGRRAWVVKAYAALQSGKLVIEGEAPAQDEFEAWLKANDWEPDEIHRVNYVHEEGQVWPMRF